jgi:hypothetical protein
MVEAVVDNQRRGYILFSRSLRVGAGSFDDGRQTNALSGVRKTCGCGEIGKCLVKFMAAHVNSNTWKKLQLYGKQKRDAMEKK